MLLPNKKNSKAPGDNEQMVKARHEFLQKGYYKSLADKLADTVGKYAELNSRILDAGCGCGYYLRTIKEKAKGNYFGVDISKSAVKLASKLDKTSNYAVASVFDLPFEDNFFDVIACVFSPHAFAEYHRVLKDNGKLIVVFPAEKHLYELKEILYKSATIDNNKTLESELFLSVDCQQISNLIKLENNADLVSLFQMTPYFYTTPQSAVEELKTVDSLQVTVSFNVEIFKKL